MSKNRDQAQNLGIHHTPAETLDNDHDTLELVINHDLNKLSIWSGKWPMSFNPDITEIMTCSNME
jgi:hypothetical protein